MRAERLAKESIVDETKELGGRLSYKKKNEQKNSQNSRSSTTTTKLENSADREVRIRAEGALEPRYSSTWGGCWGTNTSRRTHKTVDRRRRRRRLTRELGGPWGTNKSWWGALEPKKFDDGRCWGTNTSSKNSQNSRSWLCRGCRCRSRACGRSARASPDRPGTAGRCRRACSPGSSWWPDCKTKKNSIKKNSIAKKRQQKPTKRNARAPTARNSSTALWRERPQNPPKKKK